MTIIFIGDIHRQWDLVSSGLAGLTKKPDAAVLLGDIECARPLDDLAAPLLDRGIDVHWIFGNHDNDGGPDMWANLTDPRHNPRTASGARHGKVNELAGLRIAGLGGTFRPRIWNPPHPPAVRDRDDLIADLARSGPDWKGEHIAAMVHSLKSAAIWPEDYDALASQRADILVTHEAPSSHKAGKAALDALARAMGARLIVHGHHHVTYRAIAADGLQAQGVAAGWAVDQDGTVLSRGEKPRDLPHMPEGWISAP